MEENILKEVFEQLDKPVEQMTEDEIKSRFPWIEIKQIDGEWVPVEEDFRLQKRWGASTEFIKKQILAAWNYQGDIPEGEYQVLGYPVTSKPQKEKPVKNRFKKRKKGE